MLKKLRIKFICILMSIVATIFCLAFAALIYTTKNSLEKDSLRILHEVSKPEPPFDHFEQKPDKPRLPYFIIQKSENGSVSVSGSEFYDLENSAYFNGVLEQVLAAEKETDILKDYHLRYLLKHTADGITISCVDTTYEQAAIESLLKSCILLGSTMLAVFFLISLLLARWAVKPVEIAWQQQKQFIADASHELKTPLTVILTNAELIRDASFSEAEKSQFTDNILTMSHQMRGLVNSLLNLAKIDSMNTNTLFSAVDLSRLINNSLLTFDALFFEQNMDFSTSIEDGIFVTGNDQQLCQILEILLDNALKYASEKASVHVSLKQHGHSCVLSVSNTGPAISPADLKQIFKRFYRVDPARHMNGSYGLGLSIAESIVASHHGRIWAESADGTNHFYIQLPII